MRAFQHLAHRLNGSFFFPAVLVGPSFDYSTYDALVLHKIYDITPPDMDDSQGKMKTREPFGRRRVAMLHLVLGLVFLGVYAVYGGRASYERILTPVWYSWGPITRFGFIQFAGVIARTKYYAAWSLTEVSHLLDLGVLTSRGRAFSQASASTGTIPRPEGLFGTAFEISIFSPSKQRRASRFCSIIGIPGRM